MRRLIVLITLLVASAGVVLPTQAQTDVPKCDLPALAQVANVLKFSGDKAADKAALIKLINAANGANVACNGFFFTGTAEKVLGPLDIPSGIWRATLYTESGFVFSADALEGNCGQRSDSTSVFTEFINDRVGITEALFWAKSECKMIVKIGAYSDAKWQLTIEPLR